MYADDYVVGAILYFLGIVWLTARLLAWEETKGHPQRTLLSFLILFLGVCLFGGSLSWEKHRHTMHLAERQEQSSKKDVVIAPSEQHDATARAEVTVEHPVSAKCYLPKDLSACEIKCIVNNPRNSAASNVSVGFNGIYPYGTRLAAGTETHMTIKKQETLPLPMTNGYLDKNLLAFSVEIPSIPPKTALSFALWSMSDDNQRACTYLKTIIRSEQRRKIDRLVGINKTLDPGQMVSLQEKKSSLYVPGYLMSPEGRRKVEFVTDREEKTARSFADLYEKVGKEIGGKRCLIPIFAAERSDGGFQYFANAPPMMTWVFNTESLKQTPNRIETDPHPPKEYFCESEND